MKPEIHPSISPAPPVMGRLVYLDVLRAIAIFLVLGYHQYAHVQPDQYGYDFITRWGLAGWTRVDLFFVLSGFLIGGLLLNEYQDKQRLNIARFYIRRGFKIWPSYLVLICVVVVYLLLFHRHSAALNTHGVGDVARLAWPYFVHIQNYYGPLHTLIVHTWSLAVEEHFYLVLPLILLALTHWRRYRGPEALDAIPWIYAATALVCLTWRTANYLRIPNFGLQDYYFPTHLRIDSLMAGVFLAYMVRFRPHVIAHLRHWRPTIFVFSLLCYLPAVLWERNSSAFLCTAGFTVLAFGSMGLVLLAWFADQDLVSARQALPYVTAPPWARFLAWIGLYSYSIYLWHMPFQGLLLAKLAQRPELADRPWFPLAVILVYVAVTIVIGMVMYRLVERPALAIRDRWFPSRIRITDHPQAWQDHLAGGRARQSGHGVAPFYYGAS